jgi:SAM-dependent methyltransferase
MPAQRLARQIGITEPGFANTIGSIRARNAARLREGEIDHLIFYMLQSAEFTREAPIDPADAAASQSVTPAIRRRIADFSLALRNPKSERQRYFATFIPKDADHFLQEHLIRVLRWIREKEIGCRTAPSPQACIAELYVGRGHSSDTSPQSMEPVRAAFDWLERHRSFRPKRILIVGPGLDFAPRTALQDRPPIMYQPGLTRKLAGSGVKIDCVDLNPRVVRAAAGECDEAQVMDIAAERLLATYDAVIATNVLLYLDEKELLLALHNVRRMLAPNGVFIHNDGRFAIQVFGRAAGLPVIHFESLTVGAARSVELVDRFVIHSPADPKL